MSTFIPPTPAATKSAEQHEEPSEQDSFNHLLFKVLRLTSEQVQDLNDWMIHRGTPNIHEVIVQSFRRPHALEDDLHFIRENKTCYIKAHVMISLSLMIAYIKHLRHSGKATHFGPFYYIQIDPQDYDEWRIETPEEEIHFQTPSKLGSPATPRSMATSVASESYITLTNFKKGIKRDASAYPIFKNERYYNTFIRHFKATAKAQGLNTLMDPNFTPGSDEYEQQLFQEQQDFLYSVLISSLKTDFSEALVKDHEGDAQLILELLHEHHTGNSQYSRSEINRITKYLTNIKLDDTWRGTNESFLMHYNDQLRLLDSLVDPEEKLPDNTRVTFLESAVESVPDLRRVKITDNVLQAQLDSTRPITYKSYFDLLKDAAFHLDQATKRGNKIRRTNVHFSGPNDEGDHQNPLSDDLQAIQQEDVCSEPPEPLSYSVFQSHFQGSSTSSTQKIFLPKHIWEKLSKDQQQMIIDHNRSLPKSGSSSILTPNKSPSPLPHKPTPQQTAKSQQVHTHQSDESTADSSKIETTPSDPLLAMVHQSIHPSDDDASDITKVLSAKRSRQIQVCKHYIFQHANHTNNQLVDRGANGGLAGSDMRVIYKTHRKINISGIDNHEVNGLDVVTAATLLNTSLGKVIGIFNEYAHLGKGSSIHSSGQLEWFKTHVDEKSIKVGGTQLITTLDGYSVPLLIKDGLAYAISLGRPTDHDMDSYPHVFFTSPDEWDPSVLDHDPPPLDGLDPSQMLDQPFGDPMFDAYGDFNERIIANLNILLDAPPEDCRSYTANLHQSSSQEPDWNALRPFFAWTSPSSIQDTFNVTTRHGIAPHTQDYIKKHFKSRNLVFNIPRRSEAVATDTIFSDTPAVDDGSTMAQFFCGRDTLVCDAYGIKSTKQFINTLSDNIRKRGAMDTLISDGGKYEISKRVTDLLRSLFIKDYQSEPYHQHQNKAENQFGLAKRYTNTVMNTSGCPACCWLLCLQYICVVLNHLASPTLQGICPIQALEGTTPDISFLLHFSFYEPIYYRIDSSEPDLNFPSSSNEKQGYWVGFADNQGDCLTWRILTEDTQKIIIRSGVRSALRTTTNQRLASSSGEGTTLPFPIPYPQQSQLSLPLDPLDESNPTFEHFVNSQSGEDEDNPIPMTNIDIPNLLGRSFLLPPEDNGERHMAKIVDIDDHGQPLEDIKFKLKIHKDQAEEIMSYNQLMDYIQKGTDAEEDPDSLFKFRDIIAHQGPLESTDPDHKGSRYNVMVEWESGEITYEPLALISKDDPITCAVYAKKHEKKYNLKLKGVGPLEYHLGCTYKKDPDGTLAADPRRYVNKILESYERMFMEKPRKSRPPLEGGDHPELDTSELCDEHQTKQFQTLIGQLQWLISLGRFDIAVHVMSLSRFRAQSRKGHLDRAKRIVGYLLFLPDGAIRFRTGEPDFSSLRDQEYDWTRTVYSGACEQIPHDIPKPLGKHVQTTHYVDANLHHDLATGKAVTAVLHFLNQTPIDAYTKRQSTVETATYGSEFVAARTAVDQIIDIRTTLRYLGVPIRDMSYMFGDNRSVVTSSTIPNSTISKRHHLASYHRVREAIAAKFISFHWKDGKSNPADILSKHWEFATVWPMLKPILFWRGETATQLKGSDRIPSTTPGAEPPRDAKDSGSARPHSTHPETSSTNRP